MTHDELLAKIDWVIELYKDDKDARPLIKYLKSLRAVVELHRPVGENGNYSKCMECDAIYTKCKTIQAIEKELQ